MASTSYDDHHNNSIDTTRFQNQVTNRQGGALSPQQLPISEYNDTSMDGTANSSVANANVPPGHNLLLAAQQQLQQQQMISSNLPAGLTSLSTPNPTTQQPSMSLPMTMPQQQQLFNSMSTSSLLPPQPQTMSPSLFANLAAGSVPHPSMAPNQNNHLPPFSMNSSVVGTSLIQPPPPSVNVGAGQTMPQQMPPVSNQPMPIIPSQLPISINMPVLSTATLPTSMTTAATVSSLMCSTSPQHSLTSPRSSTPTQAAQTLHYNAAPIQQQLQMQQQQQPQHSPQLLAAAPATPPTIATPVLTSPITTSTALGPPPPLNIHAVQEAKEKMKQEKKEKHATKKLMKELAVCKTVLGEMEVSFGTIESNKYVIQD